MMKILTHHINIEYIKYMCVLNISIQTCIYRLGMERKNFASLTIIGITWSDQICTEYRLGMVIFETFYQTVTTLAHELGHRQVSN